MPVELAPLPVEPEPLSPRPRRDRRLAIALLLAGVACTGMGQSIVFAVLPALGRSLGFHDRQVALIFLLSSILWVFLGPFWGRRSDRYGRKPFVMLGLSGFALSMTLFSFVIDLGLAGAISGGALFAAVMGARSIYGFIGSATPSAAQGYIADRTSAEERTAGVAGFSAAFGIGAMIGPGIGGAVSAIGPIAPLYLTALLAAVMVVLIALYLPERTAPIERAPRVRLSLFDSRLRSFLIFALSMGLINAILIQTIGFYMLDALDFSEKEGPQFTGIALMCASMASLFSQLVLVQRFRLPAHMLMRIGPALLCAGHLLVAIGNDFGPVVFGLVLSGFGAGMAIPGYAAAASLAVGSNEQGSAAGLTNSAGTIGFVAAPLIGFSLFEISPHAPFLLTATIAAGLLVFALVDPKIIGAGRMTN
jgi:MFS family permease